MVYAIYLASFAGQSEPTLLYSLSFSDALPMGTSAIDSLCAFNARGIDADPSEPEEGSQQLLRNYEGNDIFEYVLRQGKVEFAGAFAQCVRKDKKKDFVSGSFRLRDCHLLVHWMSTWKGTALMMIAAPSANPAIVRSNLRMILSSLANRIRLDQPREVLVKSHIVALTLRQYVPCGQLLLHPQGMQKQVDEVIGKLLK